MAAGRIAYAGSEAATISGDGDELAEAIKNVIENALKYAPDSPVAVEVASGAGRASVTVRDRGPGMSASDAEHAFDRFYRGSERAPAEGSGLGLAIAKRAVERADGTIALESVASRGTAVTMTFPQP
jgi:two-component system sensor histidine kinase TctE